MAASKELVNNVVKQLTDIYDLKNGKIEVIDKGEYDLINLSGKSYTIYPTNDRDVDDIVSYITADLDLQPKTISKIEEGNNAQWDKGKNNSTDTIFGVSDGISNSASYYSPVSEELDKSPDIAPLSEDYPSLLVAIDSEKDAEITYKTLIEIEKSSDKPNQQVIDLLEKILADELEHIALLSALSASKNSEYVAEDSQEQFDEYVDDMSDDSKE